MNLHCQPRRATLAALFCLAGLAFALTLALGGAAQAQTNYPDKPIRFVVPYPPGGGTDVIARIVVERFQAALGQTIVIDNKGGAGGSIGSDLVAMGQGRAAVPTTIFGLFNP